MRGRRLLRVALVLLVLGLLTEGVALLNLTPLTFLLFVGVGAPLIVAAVLLYLAHVVRELTARRAL